MDVDALVHALKMLRRRGDFGPMAIAKHAPTLCELVRSAAAVSEEPIDEADLASQAIRDAAAEIQPPQLADIFRFVCLERGGQLTSRRQDAGAQFGFSESRIRAREDEALVQIAALMLRRFQRPRLAGAHRLVLVTAHNGTGLRDCLEKYRAQVETPTRRPPTIFALEDRFIERCVPDLDDSLPRRGIGEPPTRRYPQVFRLSQPRLRRAWSDALEDLAPDIDEALGTGDVILSFSASLYHQESRSIFSPVDIPQIVELAAGRTRSHGTLERLWGALAPDAVVVVTLVDDVFDCFARLSAPGENEVFDPTNMARALPYRSALIRTVLEWRNLEVRFAEGVARSLNCEHLVLPTKHSIATFDRLIGRRRPVCYLSSPTTLPRQLGEAGQATLDLVEAVASRLRSDPRIALVEPKTIDEDRFRVDHDGGVASEERLAGRLVDYPTLQTRAPELLWAPLSPEAQAVAEQPFAEVDGLNWPSEDRGSLSMLRHEIRNQLVWRNRLLLNAAGDALALLHPYCFTDARIRPGAKAELALYDELYDYEAGRRRPAARRPRQVFVFHPDHEERARRLRALEAVLRPPASGADHGGSSIAPVLLGEADPSVVEPALRAVLDRADHLGHAVDRSVGHTDLGRCLIEQARQAGVAVTCADRTWPAPEHFTDRHFAAVGEVVARCLDGRLPASVVWSVEPLAGERVHWISEPRGTTDLARHLADQFLENILAGTAPALHQR